MSARTRRWAVYAASVAGLVVTVSACVWQIGRGQEKDRLAAALEVAAHDAPISLSSRTPGGDGLWLRRVRATGVFEPSTLVLQDNQTRAGQPGYVVYTALVLEGGRQVLVKRGWVAGATDRQQLPAVVTAPGPVDVEGVAIPPSSRFFELGTTDLHAPVWLNVTVDRYRSRFGGDFLPLILEQRYGGEDGLARQWPAPPSGSAKNYGYAFQWAAMATLIVVLNVIFGIRRARSAQQA